MKRLILLKLLFATLLLTASSGFAAITLQSEASVAQIEPNGVFEWRVTVSGGTKTPKVSFGVFQLVGGPSTSQQISFINGSMSQSLELVYILRAPSNPGTYDLPVATLESASTSKHTITVTSQGDNSVPPSKAQPGRQSPQNQSTGNRGNNNNNLAWIEVSSSPKEVFVGDRVRVTYRIFFYQAQNLQITDLPQGAGFSLDNAKEIKQYKVERMERNGKPVNSAVVYDVWITPTRSGTIEVEPLEAQIEVLQQVQRRNNPNSIFNDPFSMFNDPMFNSTVVPIKVTSSKVTIQAKPLPGGK
ncbi:MAG: BatD family protein, partial [bacterium]|nr:BatD family protein [bacterium]